MYILDTNANEKIEAVIEPVSAKDWAIIKRDANFRFNWQTYKAKEVYKLHAKRDKKILGLMCITDHTDHQTNAIEIDLLEVGDENVGRKKAVDRIAGVLLAHGCRESIKRGHEGYIFFNPKTALIGHYQAHYGFQYTGPIGGSPTGVMVGDGRVAINLIRKYLD